MPTLSSFSNVYNTAAVLLQRKGYQLWVDREAETPLFMAEKDGWDFAADSPVELLGIIAIFEAHSPDSYSEYWWRIEKPSIYGDLPTKPAPYVSVMKKNR